MKVVKFVCGKYGVTDGVDFYSRAYNKWREGIKVSEYCKMSKKEAYALLSSLDNTVVKEL